MDNKEAVEILRKGYPDINKYAPSELEDFDDDVRAYDEAVNYAISHLEADTWNVIHTDADLPKESDNYLIQLDNNWNEQLTAFFSKGVGFCFMGSILQDVIACGCRPEDA